MSDTYHEESGLAARRLKANHHPAEIVFGALAFAFALFLLVQIPRQTTWIDGAALVRQPAFWPFMSIIGMILFGSAELWACWRRSGATQSRQIAFELLDWLRGLEYVLWFLAYVWLVPLTGYLPTSLVFCTTLAFRLGYRTTRSLAIAGLVGLIVVIVFKTFLSVRIPGGAVYEYLPPELRNLMILYF